jgi:peptidoglycan L-alanyl-D-glutamate endopeptidase CwlK
MTQREAKLLSELDKNAVPIFSEMLKKLDEKIGSDNYYIVEGRRTQEVQNAYYAQDRDSLEVVNEKRKIAGLNTIGRAENENAITTTLKSKHIDGKAMDIVPYINKAPTWNVKEYREEFEAIVRVGSECGLECGAKWREFPDWPHYEIKG